VACSQTATRWDESAAHSGPERVGWFGDAGPLWSSNMGKMKSRRSLEAGRPASAVTGAIPVGSAAMGECPGLSCVQAGRALVTKVSPKMGSVPFWYE
jgi:hypothetical protein